MKAIPVTVTAALLLSSGVAAAASFDCTKARSPFEKTVCADPALSRADEALAAAYRADRMALSPEGQGALQRSQRSWLAYAMARCRPGDTPLDAWRWRLTSGADFANKCLADVYRRRTGLLAASVVPLGGHVFLATTIYRVRAAHEAGSHGADAVEWTAIQLQIDRPANAREVAWNRQSAADLQKSINEPGPEGDETFERTDEDVEALSRLVSAGPDLIGTESGVSTYGKGAAHPLYGGSMQTWSLKLGRALTAQDIFDDAKPWRPVLVRAVSVALKHADLDLSATDKTISQAVLDVGHWSVVAAGLQVTFGEYELDGYAPPDPVVVGWRELRAYLNPALPGRLRGLEDAPSS